MQWDLTAFSGPDKWHGRQLTSHEWSEDHGFQLADARCLIDLRSNEEAWPNLLRELGCTDLADDPRFATEEGLDVNVPDLPRLTAGLLTGWTFAELEPLVRDKYDGTIVPMLSLPEVVAHPQVQHLGVIRDGSVRFPMEARQ
jgi:crotonobetainyl-CoA:carnitine CoA-transferase CaiB-like acyl-CoA transferase